MPPIEGPAEDGEDASTGLIPKIKIPPFQRGGLIEQQLKLSNILFQQGLGELLRSNESNSIQAGIPEYKDNSSSMLHQKHLLHNRY